MPQPSKRSIARLNSPYMQRYDTYMERQKEKKKRLIRRLVLFSLIVTIVIGSMATYHMKQRSLHAEKAKQYEQLEERMASLKKQEDQLKEEIRLLNNDEYILEIARTNYFFSKEGELIFKVPHNDPSY